MKSYVIAAVAAALLGVVTTLLDYRPILSGVCSTPAIAALLGSACPAAGHEEAGDLGPRQHPAFELLLEDNDDAQAWQQLLASDPSAGSARLWSVSVLHAACALGMPQAVRAVLMADRLASVNSRTNAGQTCLSLAAEYGQADVIGLLASAGRAVDGSVLALDGTSPAHLYTGVAQGWTGRRPVRQADTNSKAGVLNALVRVGVDINAVTRGPAYSHCLRDGLVLSSSTSLGRQEAECILSSLLTPSTALGHAVAAGDESLVRLLLSLGARHDVTSPHGVSPMHLAVAHDEPDLLAVLLGLYGGKGGGKEQVQARIQQAVNARIGVLDYSAVHVAAVSGAGDKVWSLLLDAGAEVGPAQDRGHGKDASDALAVTATRPDDSPLRLAALFGHTHAVRAILIQAGAVASSAKAGNAGSSGKDKSKSKADELLEGKASDQARILLEPDRPASGRPLAVACASGHAPVVRLLALATAAQDGYTTGEADAQTCLDLAKAGSGGGVAGNGSTEGPGSEDVLGLREAVAMLLPAVPPPAAVQRSGRHRGPTDEDCRSRRILNGHRVPFTGSAPPAMPRNLTRAYTRCGAIPVGDYYVDDSLGGQGSHYKFGRKDIDKMLVSAQRMLNISKPGMLGSRGWLAQGLKDHQDTIRGARVVVFGSMQPLVETLLLAVGAGQVTSVEYNRITYVHPQLATVTPDEVRAAWAAWEAAVQANGTEAAGPRPYQFDVALSISSFDHDGLGRYGDPLCPDCDLLANDEVAKQYLDPRGPGLYYLTVPVGPDVVVWNLHRRYGRVRLPLLLHTDNGQEYGLPVPASLHEDTSDPPLWHILGQVGWPADTTSSRPSPSEPLSQDSLDRLASQAAVRLDDPAPWTKSYEPVWVLRARR